VKAKIEKGGLVFGSTINSISMGQNSFSFKSVTSDLVIENNGFHTSMPKDLSDISKGMDDWRADMKQDVGSAENYNKPQFGNPRSFKDQHEIMRQRDISPEDIEKDVSVLFRMELIQDMIDETYGGRQEWAEKIYAILSFGTSGLRSVDEDFRDRVVYENVVGFVKGLKDLEGWKEGETKKVLVADDLRPSSPKIRKAIAIALAEIGVEPIYAGELPSPVIAYYAQVEKVPSIMITGSHIPFGRNGIKFYKTNGEVLKADEGWIKAKVAEVRKKENGLNWNESMFDIWGDVKNIEQLSDKQKIALEKAEKALDPEVVANQLTIAWETYIARYVGLLEKVNLNGLDEKKIAFWEHSAVGRDLIPELLKRVGIKADRQGRLESGFLPLDTEKITPKIMNMLEGQFAEYKKNNDGNDPFALITTDGDSDRPLLTYRGLDGKLDFLPGDQLGKLVVDFLTKNGAKPNMVALPVSTNTAVVALLENMKIDVVQTQIGSPHIIKAMNDWKSKPKHENDIVVGWEANGGFLLGSDIELKDKSGKVIGKIEKLATRDAVFPLLCALALASQESVSVAQLIENNLKHPDTGKRRFNNADVYDNFKKEFNASDDAGAKAIMAKTLAYYKPTLVNERVVEVDFEAGISYKQLDSRVGLVWNHEKKEMVTDNNMMIFETVSSAAMAPADVTSLNDMKTRFESIYSKYGFPAIKIKKISILDGIRITFMNNEIVHLRPSGNAPEFRSIAEAETLERAQEIVKLGATIIIPTMAYVAQGKTAPSNLGASTKKATTAIDGDTTGRYAIGEKAAWDENVKKLVEGIKQGKIISLEVIPFTQLTAWGDKEKILENGNVAGKIGEYWYGLGIDSPEQSAGIRATIDGETIEVPFGALVESDPNAVIGNGAVRLFGKTIPLVKILTPGVGQHLSVQNHPTKNESWQFLSVYSWYLFRV
ncbi:MAG: hypothetical protein HQL29_06140, partial [Candidatus Omnitrophica bacterium]|nr:hypothetical protein [Candidatus Omnitrophota bacterium]